MRKIYKLSLIVLFVFGASASIFGQNKFFTYSGENVDKSTAGKREVFPQKFGGFSLDITSMKNFLWSLPTESSVNQNRNAAPIMEIPMPDGRLAKFHVWESSIMEPGLAAKFPDMKQFLGQGIDDPYATIRFDYNPFTGIHGQILSSKNGRVFIDPYTSGDINYYMSYFAKDVSSQNRFICDVPDATTLSSVSNRAEAACLGGTLRTYRLALACTGEYAVAVNGPTPTVPGVAAAMLTAVNRVSGVYETEVAVRMVLVSNNNLLIYLDGATDPYTNTNGVTMLGQNQTNIDAIIGSGNYDIGHVFSTGGGGVAGLGVVCTGSKARGVTGLTNPVGDAFYIDYVAHEMGHQYSGNHTFNSVTSNCGGGNRNGGTAYEVGSGTSIQAYAGICGADNIQPNSDPFFHAISLDEISNHINGTGNCATPTATGNTLPVINPLINNGLTIPINTPFTLNGTASDANGDALTYCWEEWDLGPGGAWNGGATSTTAPLFKSRIPKTTGERTFPDIAVIVAGFPANPAATMGGLKGETMPTVARVMNFRLTVRDNRAGGGGTVSSGTGGCQTSTPFVVNVAGSAPFAVTVPNGGESYSAGSAQTITWDVAGTNAAPFNVANVRISLSTDGGLTYPTLITASTPNDGSESFVLPCITNNTVRIKVEAIGNIFFDISNTNFSIQQGFDFNTPASLTSGCPVPTSMSVTLGSLTGCGFSTPIVLSESGVPSGTTVSYSANPVAPGSSSIVTLNGTNTLIPGTYTITITGTAGTVTKTRNLTFIISTGASANINTQPFNQTACLATTASFTVGAANAVGYQWQVSTAAIPAFTDISGATNPIYTITGVTLPMNGNQYRVIANASCGASATSSPALLTIVSPVTISAQPVALVICSGSNASFSVAGSSSQTIVYQWQENIGSGFSNISNGGIYSGANTNTLTITGATSSMNTYQYRCQLSNTSCMIPTSSASVLLTVRQLPTVTLTALPLTSLLPGQTTTLTATPSASTGGVLVTSWFFNTTGIANVGNTRQVNIEQVGDYQVKIAETWPSSLVCQNQSAVVSIIPVVSSKLFIFPSPNDGRFTVSYYNNGGTATKRKIIIADAKGAIVYNGEFSITGAYTLININLEKANTGIYIIAVGDAAGKRLAVGKVHIR